jgi:hypothetical protein
MSIKKKDINKNKRNIWKNDKITKRIERFTKIEWIIIFKGVKIQIKMLKFGKFKYLINSSRFR